LYFSGQGNFERKFEFEVNEVDFEYDESGIEYFTHLLLPPQSQTFELIPVIMGDATKRIPNPLTSVIKVNHESAEVDPNEPKEDNYSRSHESSVSVDIGPDVDNTLWEWRKDVYGYITIIDLPRLRQLRFSLMFRDYILSMSPNEELRRRSDVMLSDQCGWLINCHVANLPFQLNSMVHRNLLTELRKEIEAKRFSFLKYFVMICRVHKVVKDQKFEHPTKRVKGTIVFQNQEEEFYYRRAVLSFMSPIHNENTYDNNTPSMNQTLKYFNLVVFFSRDRYNKIIKSMESAVE